MSDSRFHLKAELTIYGQTFKWEPSLNWSVGNGEVCEVDQRIIDWLRACYLEAHGKYLEDAERYEREAAKRRKDQDERKLYEQLRAKYQSDKP